MGVKSLGFRSCHNSSRLTGENGIIFKFSVEGDFPRFVSRVYNFYSKPVTKIGPGLKDPNVRMVSTIELDPLKKVCFPVHKSRINVSESLLEPTRFSQEFVGLLTG